MATSKAVCSPARGAEAQSLLGAGSGILEATGREEAEALAGLVLVPEHAGVKGAQAGVTRWRRGLDRRRVRVDGRPVAGPWEGEVRGERERQPHLPSPRRAADEDLRIVRPKRPVT